MDHHYSKNMFLLKPAEEGGQSTAVETENNAELISEERVDETPLKQIPEEQPTTEPDGELATETGVDAEPGTGADKAVAEPPASQVDLPVQEPEISDQDTIVPVEAAEDDDTPEDERQVEDPPE